MDFKNNFVDILVYPTLGKYSTEASERMSGHRTNSPLEQLLEEIKFQRRKELRTQV